MSKKKILLGLFLAGLFLLPLIYWPKAAIPYEIPKVWFFQRWVEVLGVLGVFGVLRELGETKKKKRNYLPFGVAFLVLVAVLTSLLGADFGKSLAGNYYRQDGLLTLFHFAVLFYLLALFWEDAWKRPTVKSLVLGSFGASLWVIISGIRFHLLKDLRIYHFETALGGTFGQPNFLAGYLLVSLPLTGFLIENSTKMAKNFWSLVLISQVLAICLTLSRAGILGMIIFFTGWFLLKKVKLGDLGILGALGILMIGSFWVMGKSGGKWDPESRERIFYRGIVSWSKRPILGWGWANFDYAYESVRWPIETIKDSYVDKAHSHFLEILVATGIAGLLTYLALIFLTLKQLLSLKNRLWQRTLTLVFLLFLWHSQTNVISLNEEMLFWLILGIIGAQAN